MEMPHYKLVYFDIYGRAEFIQMTFGYAGVAFEDQRVTAEQWQEMKPSKYFSMKS